MISLLHYSCRYDHFHGSILLQWGRKKSIEEVIQQSTRYLCRVNSKQRQRDFERFRRGLYSNEKWTPKSICLEWNVETTHLIRRIKASVNLYWSLMYSWRFLQLFSLIGLSQDEVWLLRCLNFYANTWRYNENNFFYL